MYGRASLGLLKRELVFSDLCFNQIEEETLFSVQVTVKIETKKRYI